MILQVSEQWVCLSQGITNLLQLEITSCYVMKVTDTKEHCSYVPLAYFI
jgi:hypothetical protein